MAKASGRIGLPELIVGVPFPVIALEIMRAALAPAVLQDAVFGGENRTPEEAVAQGFVDALVTPDALEREAQEAAERLARIPTRNFTLTKRAVRAPFLRNVAHAREALDPKIDAQWHAPETLEAVRRFVEKTLPA